MAPPSSRGHTSTWRSAACRSLPTRSTSTCCTGGRARSRRWRGATSWACRRSPTTPSPWGCSRGSSRPRGCATGPTCGAASSCATWRAARAAASRTRRETCRRAGSARYSSRSPRSPRASARRRARWPSTGSSARARSRSRGPRLRSRCARTRELSGGGWRRKTSLCSTPPPTRCRSNSEARASRPPTRSLSATGSSAGAWTDWRDSGA
mmetsp:Transcript_1633/g.2563  ORF Transcript_1633/g.2563 Transcript_1633/m.2563 type:complete len:209 (-) Transcript_1633:20-646(-)